MNPSPEPDPSGMLCEEILAEGRRRAEGIREAAREAGQALLAKTQAEAQASLAGSLEEARREAERIRERILADVPVELARLHAARTEALLESLREGALRKILARKAFDYREALASLASEALAGMDGEAFTLSLAPEDMPLGEELLRRLGRPGLTLVEDPTITSGGLILRDAEGRQLWDDRLAERLSRLWPDLRLPLARALGLLGGP